MISGSTTGWWHPHSRRDYRQNPILALTTMCTFDLYAEASKLVDVIAVFAVDAVEVGLLVDIGKMERVAQFKWMACRKSEAKTLGINRCQGRSSRR
ncbi:hypothetical protein [Mesorhizobium sp. Root695]|uniref:hypothetical protein n=1 Tax=Mesorhizobium sp. Root695 TaxID=1736589 RepID=UPI0012E374D6|nr:hypothetical protein [Mesorhizobium sp. Root695]